MNECKICRKEKPLLSDDGIEYASICHSCLQRMQQGLKRLVVIYYFMFSYNCVGLCSNG